VSGFEATAGAPRRVGFTAGGDAPGTNVGAGGGGSTRTSGFSTMGAAEGRPPCGLTAIFSSTGARLTGATARRV
jgi:hypothetical protein